MSDTKQDSFQKSDIDGIHAYDINEVAQTLTKGIRKWEKVIYPMMVAFIILAAYGFWLIYNVTKDMNNISNNMIVMTKAVVTMTNTLNKKMNAIENQMVEMNGHMASIDNLDTQLTKINTNFGDLTQSLNNMDQTLTGIYQSVYYMGYSTNYMSSNLSELNSNISAPMHSMNSIIPWSVMPGKNKRTVSPAQYRQPLVYPVPQRLPTPKASTESVQPKLEQD